MGSLLSTIQRFLGNKNTVTILAVLAGVIVLWYFYNQRVNAAITTISIPYSTERMEPGTKIDLEKVDFKEITKTTTNKTDIVLNINDLDGKYICLTNAIPQNGFFYKSQLCEEKQAPDSILGEIPEGYTLYNLKVNNEMTYSNTIVRGSYIDLYVSAVDDDRNIIFGRLIESIEVLAVRDSQGKDLYWDATAGDAAELLFAVPEEYHLLLEVAELLTTNNVKISPVPRSKSYTQNPGETKISSVALQQFIMRKWVDMGSDS